MELLKHWLIEHGWSQQAAGYLSSGVAVLLVILLCVAVHFVTKYILGRLLANILKQQPLGLGWGRALLERRVFQRLSHLVPAIIIHYFAPAFPRFEAWIDKLAQLYIITVILLALNALLDAAHDIYTHFEVSKSRPIKGLLQIIKIGMFLIGGILQVSLLIDKNPLYLISGLGALSAVLMLIFKDAILGFVAGVQLSVNDMVRVGDWMEMPKYNADGDVMEITLTTVKVQNWDKTITMIPAYALVSESFKNWRGMQEAGGRRIKRSIFIDTTSIQFCTTDMLERFRKIHYLTDYIEAKQQEIAAYNQQHHIDTSSKVNGRNLTNIGTFRIYIQRYLENHPQIHKEMPILVRQLAPGDSGLPLEIYCFTSDTRWAHYEAVQADIFDHILAVAPAFGLRIFQKPSGYDLQRIQTGSPAETDLSGQV